MNRRVERIKGCTLHLGDSRDVLPALAAESIDAVVCDPPYDLTAASRRGSPRTNDPATPFGRHRLQSAGGFMGQRWDATGIGFDPEFWAAVLRVLKPGGQLLAFGGARNYHRMACAVEDAGFEIHDQIMWLYGSGFPKSLDVARTIKRRGGDLKAIEKWTGWGTALKPAHEPIVVARKPLRGTVAETALRFGTGPLNIAACRVPTSSSRSADCEPGRWPANVIHDGSEAVRAAFPDAPGQQAAITGSEPAADGFTGAVAYGGITGRVAFSNPRVEFDTSAARFFYCAKASQRDRDGETPDGVRNHHPTVKPTTLMRYLCRLVTPPGGLVLDPVMGSGSTGKAAVREGFRFIGIEKEPEYFEIACRRVGSSRQRTAAS